MPPKIFVAVALALVLKEKLDPARLVPVVVGFVGPLLGLGANLDTALAAGGGSDLRGLRLQRLMRPVRGGACGDAATVLATYQMSGQLLFGLVLAPLGWTLLNLRDAEMLIQMLFRLALRAARE